MNIRTELEKSIGKTEGFQVNNVEVDPNKIKSVMINEIVPSDPLQDFYGLPDSFYMSTTIPLFRKAGLLVEHVFDILDMGIYLTNAVKTPKSEYSVEKNQFENSLPYLEKELSFFPNVKVIMLMGDIAKKSFNRITKKATGKNAVPAISTYKLHHTEIYHEHIRIIPSYIMTGGNILIEKSKFQMASEDIATMAELIHTP